MSKFKRTKIAAGGVELSVIFASKFLKMDLNGHRAELREPEGVSTGGGVQATQHMVFVPKVPSDPVLTVGTVNVATNIAKVRTFECVKSLFELRYPRGVFIIKQRNYQAWFDDCVDFLRNKGMQIEVETRPPDAISNSIAPPAMEKQSEAAGVAMIVLLAALLIALVAYYLHREGLLSKLLGA